MAVPATRAQFIDWCLRRLGAPVIQINVDNDQIEDRVDEALLYWYDYHFDGSYRVLIKHQVTADDKSNGYIQMDQDVNGVIDLLPVSTSSASSLFNIEYQIRMSDAYTRSPSRGLHYYITQLHLSTLNELYVGKQPFRYNRHVNKLYIDMGWDNIATGNYLLIEAYKITDPEVFADAWADRWLQRYATALIKKQWGEHLKKFDGVQLIGGIQFNGQQIYTEAVEEIKELEEQMIYSYSLPNMDMMG